MSGLAATVLSSATGLWKLFRDQAERGSGIGPKLFGFIAESVFTIIPESCSGSSWNSVRNHPGIAFTFARIPHVMTKNELRQFALRASSHQGTAYWRGSIRAARR
jgi:hypothetical protein